jgi:hypothetical protein
MKIDRQKVARLTEADIWDIQAHLNRALDTESGSGDHWILVTPLPAKAGSFSENA